ncbi:MAG: DUF2721 domain-containing protein [Stagnimonas sp.]|nr:DUF2721 domain-containing protein [Stagnimonas sp.]
MRAEFTTPHTAMATDAEVTSIAHVIQLAVAPVFLIAGIGSMLGVLTNRLGRIVDRARRLEEQLAAAGEHYDLAVNANLRIHARRARLVQLAIGCCAFCALLICTVVVVLFVGALFSINFASLVAVIFIGAMGSFILALLFFLREIHMAITHLRIVAKEPSLHRP